MIPYTKEGRLLEAILEYAMECVRQEDFDGLDSLDDLGLRRVDIPELRALSLDDLRSLRQITYNIVEVKIDRDRLWLALSHIKRERNARAKMEYLFKHDAPLPVLHGLYGLHGEDCAVHRALFDAPSHMGRVRDPEPEEIRKVMAAVQAGLAGREVTEWTPDEWVAVHQETGVPLRVVWQIMNDAATDGNAPGGPLPKLRAID